MPTKDNLSMGITGLLVVCALFIIGLVIQKEFFSSQTHPNQIHTHQLVKHRIENWKQLEFTGQRTGLIDAPVQIVEFFDYECPFCKASELAIKAIQKRYPEKVAVVYENFPLTSIHPYAFESSIAAECARKQNAFMAYHDSLFANLSRLGSFSYAKLAAQAGVENVTVFQQCIKTQNTAPIIKASKAMGDSLGVKATPTFLIDDMLVVGELSIAELDELVKDALEEAGK